MASEYITIAEAAKRLGVARPRLSTLLADARVQKVCIEGRDLIDYVDAARVLKDAKSSGRVRKTKQGATVDVTNTVGQGYDALIQGYQTMVDGLRAELMSVKAERDSMRLLLKEAEVPLRRGLLGRIFL